MGRGRGKGKRSSITSHEDGGSGDEEKIPVQKRRGRPQKPLKDEEFDEEEYDTREEEEESENLKNADVSSREWKSSVSVENRKKKRRSSQRKEKSDSVKVENDFGNSPVKSNGFRHNGSRRKSKPRRAAEAGVECN